MANNDAIVFEGLDRLQRVMANATSPAQQQALAQAVTGAANKVLNQSKKLVPVDTGVLRDSGRVENLKVSSTEISVEITYGGAASQYAGVVHEDMTMNHSPALKTIVTKRPRRGQAKYLEIPVMANRSKFFKSIIGRYVRYFKKAGG